MKTVLNPQALAQLFTEARSYHSWQNKPVPEALLEEIYELTKWGPTSVNCGPLRITFVTTAAGKEKLAPALMGANVDQVKAAPVTAILAWDPLFYNELHRLFPAFDAKPMFAGNAELAHATAFRNSSLQGAYFIMAARTLGLDTCPMSGFDNAKVDEIFYKESGWKSNFICTLGYGDDSKLYPRGARLEFDEACKIV